MVKFGPQEEKEGKNGKGERAVDEGSSVADTGFVREGHGDKIAQEMAGGDVGMADTEDRDADGEAQMLELEEPIAGHYEADMQKGEEMVEESAELGHGIEQE